MKSKEQKISDLFEKQTLKTKIIILIGALDYMELYNGRSQTECIRLSMEDMNIKANPNK